MHEPAHRQKMQLPDLRTVSVPIPHATGSGARNYEEETSICFGLLRALAGTDMSSKSVSKTGTLQCFNLSPKGNYEGLLLQSGKTVCQVNFPQEWSGAVASFAATGDDIQVEVEHYGDERGHSSHPVYQLLSIRNSKGDSFPSRDANGTGDGHFSGKVERLNYALHGEVNGAILNTGDFLHVKPHGAVALELSIGMEVKGTGTNKPMVGGRNVIEADEVNGIALEQKPKPKKKAQK